MTVTVNGEDVPGGILYTFSPGTSPPTETSMRNADKNIPVLFHSTAFFQVGSFH